MCVKLLIIVLTFLTIISLITIIYGSIYLIPSYKKDISQAVEENKLIKAELETVKNMLSNTENKTDIKKKCHIKSVGMAISLLKDTSRNWLEFKSFIYENNVGELKNNLVAYDELLYFKDDYENAYQSCLRTNAIDE